MTDDSIKVAAVLVAAFGGGIALGYFMAPKGTESNTGGYVPLYVPSCDEVEE